MSDDDGYTLAEALTALAIVALAMVGLTQAVRLATTQASTAARLHGRAADLAAAQRLFAIFPQSAGPFDAVNRDLIGDARRLVFACGRRASCTMEIAAVGRGVRLSAAGEGMAQAVVLDRRVKPTLRYVSSDGIVSTTWPQEGQDARLAAVMLTDGDAVLAIQRFVVNADLSCRSASDPCNIGRQDAP